MTKTIERKKGTILQIIHHFNLHHHKTVHAFAKKESLMISRIMYLEYWECELIKSFINKLPWTISSVIKPHLNKKGMYYLKILTIL